MIENIIKKYNNPEFEKIKEFTSFIAMPNILPYIIPSVYHFEKDGLDPKLKEELEKTTYTNVDNELYTIGLTLGFTGLGLQSYLYYEKPEALAIIAITNLGSYIYNKKNKK